MIWKSTFYVFICCETVERGVKTLDLRTLLEPELETVTLLIAPMTPHLAEALWVELERGGQLVADTPWPEADAAYLVDDLMTIAVQVNGKLRGTIELPKDCAKDVAEDAALALDKVQSVLEGKPPRKVIVVPNRIVNVVA